ncbi:MAG: magnesium transporter MgtE N-terminal domain-containing protein [bacterium]
MAKPDKEKGALEKDAPAKKKESGASGLVLLTSSFVVVLTGMMFATGTAQRTALPRLREMAAHLPFVKAAPADSMGAANDSSAVSAGGAPAANAAWSAVSDSVAMLEERLAMAIAEIESSQAPPGDEAAPQVAIEAAEAAAQADPGAARDLARLVKVLDAMKPAEAARILNAVDNDLAVDAIRKLKERQAGKVLALMEPTKAIAVGAALGRGAGGTF